MTTVPNKNNIISGSISASEFDITKHVYAKKPKYELVAYNEDGTITKFSIHGGELRIGKKEQEEWSFNQPLLRTISLPKTDFTIHGVGSYVAQYNKRSSPRPEPLNVFDLTDDNKGDYIRVKLPDGIFYSGHVKAVQPYYIKKNDDFVIDHIEVTLNNNTYRFDKNHPITETKLKVDWIV